MMKYFLLFLVIIITPINAMAHKLSSSYLQIERAGNGWEFQWDIALHDLENAVGLDTNQDKQLTLTEVESQSEKIASYALSRLHIVANEAPCTQVISHVGTTRRDSEPYSRLMFTAQCGSTDEVSLHYGLFFDSDPTHTGLVQLRGDALSQSYLLSSDQPTLTLSAQINHQKNALFDFFREGVWHIWIGFDHILFLLTLLLPAVLVVRDRRWYAAPRLHRPFIDSVKIVTAFTVAHSITLVLASLQWVTLPARFVESVIALSVLVTAVNNLWPVFVSSRWQLAFGFGLIHGFGFANVLQNLALPPEQLALSLLGFNLGVEAGQLAILAVFFPLAWVLRGSHFYRWGILRTGSIAAVLMSFIWLTEHLFNTNIADNFTQIIL